MPAISDLPSSLKHNQFQSLRHIPSEAIRASVDGTVTGNQSIARWGGET